MYEPVCFDGGDPLVTANAVMSPVMKDILFGGDGYSSVHYEGELDDVGYFSGVLTDAEAKAVYSLAEQVELAYDVGQVMQLFGLAHAGSGQTTIGGLTWEFTTGLDGDIGLVTKIGDDFVLRLDEDGNGVITGSSILAGDLNGDGSVNSGDLDIVRGNWGQSVVPGCLLCGDASGDGNVNSGDLDIIRANWGRSAPTAVPEPGFGVAMVALAVVFVFHSSNRRRRK